MSVDSVMPPPVLPERLHILPAFTDNLIWTLRSTDGRSAMVVDPGDAEVVRRWLADTGSRLTTIFITHHHADHTAGLNALRAAGEVTVFGPRREKIAGVDVLVGEGDVICPAGLDCRFAVLDTPGHTAGHVALYGALDGTPLLFCGDTLFAAGCGRLFDGTAAQLHGSLFRLASLPAETRVCCAHEYTLANLRFAATVEPGNPAIAAMTTWCEARRASGLPTVPTTLALEERINPFLRIRVPEVKASIARLAGDGQGIGQGDPLAVFTALRRWKDQFR